VHRPHANDVLEAAFDHIAKKGVMHRNTVDMACLVMTKAVLPCQMNQHVGRAKLFKNILVTTEYRGRNMMNMLVLGIKMDVGYIYLKPKFT
jgi:hypothetical protein